MTGWPLWAVLAGGVGLLGSAAIGFCPACALAMKESGVKGLENFTFSTYTGLFAPAKLPPEILARLNAAMVTTLADPPVIKKFSDLTAETKSSTPQDLAAMLDQGEKLVVPLIKKLGMGPHGLFGGRSQDHALGDHAFGVRPVLGALSRRAHHAEPYRGLRPDVRRRLLRVQRPPAGLTLHLGRGMIRLHVTGGDHGNGQVHGPQVISRQG